MIKHSKNLTKMTKDELISLINSDPSRAYDVVNMVSGKFGNLQSMDLLTRITLIPEALSVPVLKRLFELYAKQPNSSFTVMSVMNLLKIPNVFENLIEKDDKLYNKVKTLVLYNPNLSALTLLSPNTSFNVTLDIFNYHELFDTMESPFKKTEVLQKIFQMMKNNDIVFGNQYAAQMFSMRLKSYEQDEFVRTLVTQNMSPDVFVIFGNAAEEMKHKDLLKRLNDNESFSGKLYQMSVAALKYEYETFIPLFADLIETSQIETYNRIWRAAAKLFKKDLGVLAALLTFPISKDAIITIIKEQPYLLKEMLTDIYAYIKDGSVTESPPINDLLSIAVEDPNLLNYIAFNLPSYYEKFDMDYPLRAKIVKYLEQYEQPEYEDTNYLGLDYDLDDDDDDFMEVFGGADWYKKNKIFSSKHIKIKQNPRDTNRSYLLSIGPQ